MHITENLIIKDWLFVIKLSDRYYINLYLFCNNLYIINMLSQSYLICFFGLHVIFLVNHICWSNIITFSSDILFISTLLTIASSSSFSILQLSFFPLTSNNLPFCVYNIIKNSVDSAPTSKLLLIQNCCLISTKVKRNLHS